MANISINSERSNRFELQRNTHALISFRAIVAGLLIAMFVMIGLFGLGLAFGGMGLDQETTFQSASLFSGIWFIISVFISLFIGSYFASRVSKFRISRIGSVQGLVIAALFLGFFFYQMVFALGSAGSMVGSIIGRAGRGILAGNVQIENYPTITNSINYMAEDVLGDLNLRSGPQVVAQGIGSRLLTGNTEGAKNYLAREAGISSTEADTRITQIKAIVDKYVAEAKDATASGLKSTGWTIFFLFALGSLAGILGGSLGSVANFRKPLTHETDEYYPSEGQTI